MRRLSWLLPLAITVVITGQQPRPNLLLVTVDALRADRVSARLTPAMMGLAARGAHFERAYAHAPLTLPAHASILTGLLPPAHAVRNNGFRLDADVVTLAEMLADAGYRTGAFIGSSALDARFGLSAGFHHYDDRYDLLQGSSGPTAFRQGARPSAAVLTATREWIASQGEPWFAWSHLRDPHAPYISYDHAVTAADAALGSFLSSAALQAVADRTIVLVTADHGESIGEHGERTHGVFAYEAVIRVPLIVAGPGIARRVVREPVSHVDVAPTLLDLLGVATRWFDGRSLVPALHGRQLEPQRVYFEALDAALMRGGAPLTGVVDGRWKYIDLPVPELYDLTSDPLEQRNRVATDAAVAHSLRDATIAYRTGTARADAAGALAEPEARARLRSLGYVGSASWRLGTSRPEDDPKRMLPMHLAYEAAVELAATDPEGAMGQLRLILDQRPDFAAAIDALGALLLARGKPKEAIALLSEARAGGLRHRVLAERLAAALLAARDARGAAAILKPVVEAEGAAVNARFLLARALVASGDRSGAKAQLEAALEVDPTFAAAADLMTRLKQR